MQSSFRYGVHKNKFEYIRLRQSNFGENSALQYFLSPNSEAK